MNERNIDPIKTEVKIVYWKNFFLYLKRSNGLCINGYGSNRSNCGLKRLKD